MLNKDKNKGLPKVKISKKELGFKFTIFAITSFVLIFLLILIGFILLKSLPAFANKDFSFWKFLFSKEWNPKNDGEGGSYGIGATILSTIMLLLLTLIFAIPLTIFSSIFISEYLGKRLKKVVIVFIQLLAGIPSVVFGLFAINSIGPIMVKMGAPSKANMMTAVITLTFMVLPTMITLSINAIESVPDSYRIAAIGLGVTKERISYKIVLKFAWPKIITAIFMGIARIIGETMAIMLIAGNSTTGLNTNDGFSGFLFSSIRTLSSVIGLEMLENKGVTHESFLYLIGLILFFIVIILNFIILTISRLSTKKHHLAEKTKKDRVDTIVSANKKSDYKLRLLIQSYSDTKIFKSIETVFYKFLMIISTIIVCSFTVWIIGDITIKGLKSIEFGPFLSIENQEGGIFATILATLFLVILTMLFAFPLSLIAAIYFNEYAIKKSWFNKIIKFSINVLASVPSIVFGIFGLTLFVIILKIPMSIFAASLTMTLVVLPMMIVSFEDALNVVPEDYRLASYGLGLTKSKTILIIVLPNALKGIMTGSILTISRIIGESAPVYLTMGTIVKMPNKGFLSSGATLTTEIYMLASEDPYSSVVYLLSFITLITIMILNLISKRLSDKFDPLSEKLTFKQRNVKLLMKFKMFFSFRWFNKVKVFFKKISSKIYRIFNFKQYCFKYKEYKKRKKTIKLIIKNKEDKYEQ